MSNHAMELLREHNPYPEELDALPLDALLERLAAARKTPAPQGPRMPRRTALRLTLAATILVVLAIPVVGSLGGDDFDVAAAVYDATDPGTGIAHYVTETTSTDLTGRREPSSVKVESWVAPTHNRLHTIQTQGSLTMEQTLDGRRQRLWYSSSPRQIRAIVLPRVIGQLGEPLRDLRRDLRSGRAHVTGRATVGGKRAWRLRIRATRTSVAGPQPPAMTVLADAKTFVPLQSITYGAVQQRRDGPWVKRTRVVTRISGYKRMPYSAAARRLLLMSPHAGARVVPRR